MKPEAITYITPTTSNEFWGMLIFVVLWIITCFFLVIRIEQYKRIKCAQNRLKRQILKLKEEICNLRSGR